MSQPLPQIPESPADDEIDLRVLGAALLRHRLWVLAFTALGVVLGGLVGVKQKPTIKTCLIVNTLDGPSIRNVQNSDIGSDVAIRAKASSRVYAPLPGQTSLDDVMMTLKAASYRSAYSKQAMDISIAPLEINKITSVTQVAACGTARSAPEARSIRNLLESIENVYRQQAILRFRRFAPEIPPTKYWTQIIQEPLEDPKKSRFLMPGAIGGFIAGCIAAFVADRRLNRIYSLEHLLGQLGYPLVAKLPHWPWDLPGAQSEIAQLAMHLDPELSWLVFSIGQEHPLTGRLVDALHSVSPDIDLQHIPPLLIAPVNPPDPMRPVGVLVVLESGFNSFAAVQDSRRVLASLSFVQQVGAVVVGAQMPPELRL